MKIENFGKYHKPEKNLVICLLLSLLVQVVAFGMTVPFHSLFSHMGPVLQKAVDVAGEMSEPTLGRLIFGIVTFVLGIGLVPVAHLLNKKIRKYLGFSWLFCAESYFGNQLVNVSGTSKLVVFRS